MSSDLAIAARDVGKAYTISHGEHRPSTLMELLLDRLRHPFRRRGSRERFWALRDVSFDVTQGEVLGIIGRNGAGKSTLLKILSRITEPSTGEIRLYGRTGSLLEVGTGFHRELTGRENIYLNGSILGMRQSEINRKFDEIVDFAGTERFLDTPVKRYSSGMYVRLAFAVAAHFEPEILIVDEVLAVGDAEFQKKCLGKMGEVARQGRTVLFVSHNMNAMLNLCSRALLLAGGEVIADGATRTIVHDYLAGDTSGDGFQPDLGVRGGDGSAQIVDFRVTPSPAKTGAPAQFVFDIERPTSERDSIPGELAADFMTEDGAPVLQLYSIHMGRNFMLPPGRTRIVAAVEQLPLTPGTYRIGLWLGAGDHGIDHLQACYRLQVLPGGLVEGVYVDNRGFPVVAPSSWRTVGERTTVQLAV